MFQRCAILTAAFLALAIGTQPAVISGQDIKGAPAAPDASADPVIVRVSGEALTEKQVLDSITQLTMQLAAQKQVTDEQIRNKDTVFFREALDSLIGTILLKNEAKANNLVADKAQVDQNLQSMKARLGDDAKFQQALQQQGLKEDDVRRSIETDLLCRQMLGRIAKELPPPTDADIQKYYNANLKSFDMPEQRHVAAISLKLEKNATAEEKAAARKRLENIRADIQAGKITFSQAAIKESDDKANSARGGDVGLVRRGMMVKLLEDAAFATPAGTLTEILESEIGYHLLQVIDVEPAGVMPLETARPKIKDLLERKAMQEATKKRLAELREKARIEVVMSDEEWHKRHAAK